MQTQNQLDYTNHASSNRNDNIGSQTICSCIKSYLVNDAFWNEDIWCEWYQLLFTIIYFIVLVLDTKDTFIWVTSRIFILIIVFCVIIIFRAVLFGFFGFWYSCSNFLSGWVTYICVRIVSNWRFLNTCSGFGGTCSGFGGRRRVY